MVSYSGKEMDANFSSYHQGGHGNEFSRVAETVSSIIQKIAQNVAQIQRYSKQLGTPQDSDKLREQIHGTTHYTKQLAIDANKSLKELASTPLVGSPSDQRQQRMQKERLTDEFSNSLKNFQTVQRGVAEKERASIARSRANSGLGNVKVSPYVGFSTNITTSFEIAEDRRSDDQFLEQGFSQTRQFLQMEEDVDLELIREREDAVKKLEGDILDVNQIFKDLGMLVHEQGEVIDSIEANVESAQLSTHHGTEQLGKARTFQSKARRKKCILLIIVLVVLAIIAIILGVKYGK